MPVVQPPNNEEENGMPNIVVTIIWACVALVAILVFAEVIGKAL